MKDRDLIDALKCGEEGALQELMGRYSGLLRYVVRPILCDEGDIEECLSDIYWKLWKNRDVFDFSKGSVTAWFTVVARNTALDRVRRKREDPEPLDTIRDVPAVESPEEILLRKERLRALMDVVNSLKEKERDLFYRKYYYCQSSRQIAAELGLTVRAVEGRLRRLRQKLRYSRWLDGDGI